MFCTNCGARLTEGAKFCTNCGKPVASNVADPTKPAGGLPELTPMLPEEEQNPAAPSPVVGTLESAASLSVGGETEPAEPAIPLPVEEIPEPVLPSAEVQPVETEEPLPAEAFPEPIPQPTMAESEPVIRKPTVQQVESVPSSFVQPQRKGHKKLYIVLAAVFVVATVSGGLILKWYTSPEQKFSRAMGQADYVTASNQYGRMSPQEQDAALNQLANMAWDAVQDYSGGGATYEEVDQWLEGLTTSYFPQLEGYAPEIFDMLESLHTAKEHMEKAEAAESEGDLTTALSEYEASLAASNKLADDIGPNTEDLNAKIQSIEQKYKSEIIEQAKALAERKDFSGAASLLRESQSVLGGDEEIQSLLNEYGDQQTEADISALLETAETKAKTGDYSGAISNLQGAVITDSRITTKLAEYKSGYEKQALEEAEELAKSGKYEEAVAKLNQVTTVLGETNALMKKIAEYQDKFPVFLNDLTPVEGSVFSDGGGFPDIYGNTAENAIGFAKDSEVEYLANGKYSVFSGTIIAESYFDTKATAKFQVYVDDVLKYEQGSITRKTEPIPFEVDIKQGKFVKLAFVCSDGQYARIDIDNASFHN